MRSAPRVTTPRHSATAASLGGSQVTGQPPSATALLRYLDAKYLEEPS